MKENTVVSVFLRNLGTKFLLVGLKCLGMGSQGVGQRGHKPFSGQKKVTTETTQRPPSWAGSWQHRSVNPLDLGLQLLGALLQNTHYPPSSSQPHRPLCQGFGRHELPKGTSQSTASKTASRVTFMGETDHNVHLRVSYDASYNSDCHRKSHTKHQ